LTELEILCRQAYGAYEYLRDHDLTAESGTSKLLRSGNLPKLRLRMAEELDELKGVIEGTHFHEGFDQDIILEGYEVWYWTASLLVAQHVSYTEATPHVYLETGFKLPITAGGQELPGFIQETLKLARAESTLMLKDLLTSNQALKSVGMACALNNTPPTRLLERDLTEMRQKSYLEDYWQTVKR